MDGTVQSGMMTPSKTGGRAGSRNGSLLVRHGRSPVLGCCAPAGKSARTAVTMAQHAHSVQDAESGKQPWDVGLSSPPSARLQTGNIVYTFDCEATNYRPGDPPGGIEAHDNDADNFFTARNRPIGQECGWLATASNVPRPRLSDIRSRNARCAEAQHS